MTQIRLFDLRTSRLEPFDIEHTPPYLAVSHVWSDCVFPIEIPIRSSFGVRAVQKIVKTRFPEVHYCWADTFCINQDDEADKLAQIPLMGSIYSTAEAVTVVLSCELGLVQDDVDAATSSLKEALQIWEEEAWTEEAHVEYWGRGAGRQKLVQAMRGLTRFTGSAWGTRIWTLQEYVLARSVVWIGTDMHPITVDNLLFQAVPGLCDQLAIVECTSRAPGADFALLHSHFSGMANSRLGDIDRTRIMELLGNRKATVPVDEVYGVLGASGIEIPAVAGEEKEQAWARWLEAAVNQGHIRWVMLPDAPTKIPNPGLPSNCVLPRFSDRHDLSSGSMLDNVVPLGPAMIKDGTVTLTGRYVGRCSLIRPLGSAYHSGTGLIHRDITLILFSKGQWPQALQVASAFGAGRYNRNKLLAIAQVLTNNYARALYFIRRREEEGFIPVLCSEFQSRVWADFMQLQARCIMDPINDGIGYLARIENSILGISILTMVVIGDRLPTGLLAALHFNATTADGRYVLMIAELPASYGEHPTVLSGDISQLLLHKAGTTLPISGDYAPLWVCLSMQQFSIGGTRCQICRSTGTGISSSDISDSLSQAQKGASRRSTKRLRLMLIREHRARRKLPVKVAKMMGVPSKINLRDLNHSRRRQILMRRLTDK